MNEKNEEKIDKSKKWVKKYRKKWTKKSWLRMKIKKWEFQILSSFVEKK